MKKSVAIVIGVGPEKGLGAALCRRFAGEGYLVFVAGRTAEKVEAVAATITAAGGTAIAVQVDATNEAQVQALFSRVAKLGPEYSGPSVVVFNAGNNQRIDFAQTSAEEFEAFWKIGCFAGFLTGREAVRWMAPRGVGTIIFTGASSSLRGRPGFAHFSAAKAGLRMISQSMAREYGPSGLHIAHVIVDGQINGERAASLQPKAVQEKGVDGMLDIDAMAQAYWQLHIQPRSAWTQELDLRPFSESF